jgi:hypothetical protein
MLSRNCTSRSFCLRRKGVIFASLNGVGGTGRVAFTPSLPEGSLFGSLLGSLFVAGTAAGPALRPFTIFAGFTSFVFLAAAFTGFAGAAFRALAAPAALPFEAGFVAFDAEAGLGFAVDLAGLDLAIGRGKNSEGKRSWKIEARYLMAQAGLRKG